MSHLMQPTIVLLKDGSETAQGTTHVIHNINACQAIAEIVKTTLGPRGMDKLIYADNGAVTISNDGRTIIDLLDIVHPAAKTLVDIAVSQDDMVGDGTTSVVVLAAEFLKEAKIFIEDGVHPRVVIKSFERATKAVLEKLDQLALDFRKESDTADTKRTILERCAMTTLQSKLISAHREFFAKMTVDAVSCLDPTELNLSMIGIAKVPGGSVTSSELVEGVAFRKTFSYAGFEQQPKSFVDPKIVVLNVELELKAEKENAEIRLKDPSEYQSIVDAEWSIIYDKLDKIVKSGAQIVLSKLAIGDLATQYFADRDIFCAGRVPMGDLERLMAACGGVMQTSLSDLSDDVLGTCGQFEERQVGNERYNFFTKCEHARSATIILRGGAEQFIEETHRSLWDALNVVKRCMQHSEVVGGAGAIEMELSRYLRDISKQMEDKSQMIMAGFARALEVIPRQLAHNAGLDATTTITRLRAAHSSAKGSDRSVWMGVDIEKGGIVDAIEKFIWEPALNKRMAIGAATEAACTILSIDETIKNAKAQQAADQAAAQTMAKPGGMRGGLPSIM